MIGTRKRSGSLRGFACAVATCLCLLFQSPSANAAAFQVSFDPYTELFGTATFDLSQQCLTKDGVFDFFEMLAKDCTVSMLGAHISTDGAQGTFVDYLPIYYLDIYPYVIFSSMSIVNGEFAGLTTPNNSALFLPILLDEVGSGDALSPLATASSFGPGCIPWISFTVAGSVSFSGCEDGQQLPPLPGVVTGITRVPEPGTLSLLLGGMLAGWATRRLRKAKA